MATRRVLTATGAATLALGLAGCGGGGDYETAQELWDALDEHVTCSDDSLEFEEGSELELSDGPKAIGYTTFDCYSGQIAGEDDAGVAALVTEDDLPAEELGAEPQGGPALIGSNWVLWVYNADDAASEWLTAVQEDVGGELQQS